MGYTIGLRLPEKEINIVLSSRKVGGWGGSMFPDECANEDTALEIVRPQV